MTGNDVVNNELALLRHSDLFDPAWYLTRYPDVAALGVDPARHYLEVGAVLMRDPGPGFSTRYYLKSNPDVLAEAINPLIHYITCGRDGHRMPLPVVHLAGVNFEQRVDIVIPVHNALEDVKSCLASVRDRNDGCGVHVIVVDDASDATTTEWLRDFCRSCSFGLIHNDRNLGYTHSVNIGLRASTAPHVILLNSDTIVTHGWLRGLLRCIHSSPRLGIVGPLSNAASWQNVPELRDATGGFAVNVLAEGMAVEAMAAVVARVSRRAYPRTPFVNGFCFMIARPVIDAIGFMDEQSFPLGYGEENDYCIRAADAGFELAIADDTYVFHAKSRSFGHQRRKMLSRQGSQILKRKHAHVDELLEQARKSDHMDRIRSLVRNALAQDDEVPALYPAQMRVLFLLPVGGGGGGAHSVVQEAMEMRRLGVHATVAVWHGRVAKFRGLYPGLPGIEGLFTGFDDSDVLALAAGYDVVVGTIYWTMSIVERICQAFPHILPAYYVQDYEPFFEPEGSAKHEIARASYGLLPHAVLFAKTHWLVAKVATEHGVAVHKVEPSVDHGVYKPARRQGDGRLHVVAMIRPQTPRRGAERTMRVLARLAQRMPDAMMFHLFGCAADSDGFRRLETGFAFQAYGALRREEVSALLGRSDLFVDLSDYQAFGRTAIEAMACGCAAVVPVHGGADEYATHGNALIVDPFEEDACVDALEGLVGDPDRLDRLRWAGLLAASKYSVHAAAVSELAVIAPALARHRRIDPVPSLRRLLLLPALGSDGRIAWRSYVRVLQPYFGREVLKAWRVEIGDGQLPPPGSHDAIVLQSDVSASLDALREWLPAWQAKGGLVVCDLDRAPSWQAHDDPLDAKARWLAQQADVVTVACRGLLDELRTTARDVRVIPDHLNADLWGLGRGVEHGEGPFARHAATVRLGCCAVAGDEHHLGRIARALERLPAGSRELVEVEVLASADVRVPAACKHVKIPRKEDYPGLVRWLRRRIHWDVGILLPATGAVAQAGRPLAFIEHAALDMAIACDGSGAQEGLARHGVTALVARDTCAGWFAAIRQLVSDPALRCRLARTARTEVADNRAIVDQTSVYADVLPRPTQATSMPGFDHRLPDTRTDRDPEDDSGT